MIKETVTISKTELLRLKKQAQAYRKLAASVFQFAALDPISDVVRDFHDTHLYSEDFMKDLEAGLRKSSYAKKYAHKTPSGRS